MDQATIQRKYSNCLRAKSSRNTVNKTAVNHSQLCFQLTEGINLNVIFYSWTNIWTYEHGQQKVFYFSQSDRTTSKEYYMRQWFSKYSIWSKITPKSLYMMSDWSFKHHPSSNLRGNCTMCLDSIPKKKLWGVLFSSSTHKTYLQQVRFTEYHKSLPLQQ